MFGVFWRHAEMTDGVIDLIPIELGEPDAELRFGRVRDWCITLHGKHREIGRISLRDGESVALYYYGHIGYHIEPRYQGHHYAEKACRLLNGVIRQSGKHSVVITNDPDNRASRRTCERLGCVLECTVDVPPPYQERFDLSARKCRYIWILDD